MFSPALKRDRTGAAAGGANLGCFFFISTQRAVGTWEQRKIRDDQNDRHGAPRVYAGVFRGCAKKHAEVVVRLGIGTKINQLLSWKEIVDT